MRTLFVILIFVSGSTIAYTQVELSNIRSKVIILQESYQKLDSLSIIPNSVQFYKSDSLISQHLDYNIKQDSLHIRSKNPRVTTIGDSLNIIYRVLPIDFNQSYSHLDSSKLLPRPEDVYIGYDFNIYKQSEEDLLFYKGLEYDGSFGRGLSFGNNQSLVLNSNFNLQLGGKLGEDLEIAAVISDSQIPIQPEGTTQQLQDFDKVFIQLKRKQTTLLAGDYEISRPNSYFINYYKKLQGISVLHKNDYGKFGELSQKGSVAISRGKFSRNTLQVREGNQGPYKLTGNDGERFLIVLSGTEKVYFDGKLLTRGEENDYVIYYDRAEIVFTTNRLITKDSRIIVEFEYADQKYLRSLYQYESIWTIGKWRTDLNIISQQDSRNTTGNIDIDSLDLALLQVSGDLDENAIRSGIIRNTEGYNSNQVYYKKTYDNQVGDSVLVFTNNPDSSNFLVSFSDVGEKNGSYAINSGVNANGRVYKYVGQGNGNYEPYIRLVAPEQKQMYSLRTQYQINKEGHLNLELGLSHFDLNRLSTINDIDNTGLSGRIEYAQKLSLGKASKWTFSPLLKLELKGSDFEALNPYRNAEFKRDWNVRSNQKSEEILGNMGFEIGHTESRNKINYEFSNFSQLGFYSGNRHNVQAILEKNGFHLDLQNNYLKSSSDEIQTTFSRPKINLSKKFEKLDNWSIGYYAEREKNEILFNAQTDLDQSSFLYNYSKYYIRSDDKNNFSFGISYNKRNDFSPIPGEFTKSTEANEYEVNGKWNLKKYSTSSWSFTYRSLDIKDELLTEEKQNAVLLGNFNHLLRLWNGAVNSSINYKVSSGQEPKLEFDFREVLKGEGNYIWIDDGDGIQQRNEFQIAPFQDQANYVRINLFNNEFIKTNNAGFTQSLRIDPKTYLRKLENQTNWSRFISKFSLTSNFRIDNKNRGSGSLFSIDQFSANDTSLVSFSSLYNGIIYFNRGNPKYDIQIGFRNNNNKIVQTLGFEQRGLSELFARNRIAISRNFDFVSKFSSGSKSLISEVFSNNDFTIQFFKIEPQVIYRIGNQFRMNMDYNYERKENNLEGGGESALINDFKLGITYSKERTSRINTEIKFASVQYTGESNSALELNMLDGLKNGSNILWGIDYSKRILKNIDISISYEGRKTGANKVVHVGRAQVNSSF